MSRSYKKGVLTLREIGEQVYKKCPGRFKSVESAYARAKGTAQKLGIGDINGKKRCKFITTTDAARIIEEVQKTARKRKRAEQISLFEANPIAWLDDYLPEAPETPEPEQEKTERPVPHGITEEQADAIADFWKAWTRLCKVFGNEEVI